MTQECENLFQRALACAIGRAENDAGVSGEPMMAAVAHASRVAALEADNVRMRLAQCG